MEPQSTEKIQQRLIDTKQRVLEKNRIEKRLKVLTARLIENDATEEVLLQKARAERADVQELEETTFKSLYERLFGNMESALQKEKWEYYAARMRLDECRERGASLRQAIEEYERQLQEYDHAAEEYMEALQAKKNAILHADVETAESLIAQAEEIAASNTLLRELEEAIEAGTKVESSLNKMADLLRAAIRSTVLANNVIGRSYLHQKYGEAYEVCLIVNGDLEQFSIELQDVGIAFEQKIEKMSSRYGFSEGLLGSIGVAMTNDALDKMLDEAKAVLGQVRAAGVRCRQQRSDTREQLQELEARWRETIEGGFTGSEQ